MPCEGVASLWRQYLACRAGVIEVQSVELLYVVTQALEVHNQTRCFMLIQHSIIPTRKARNAWSRKHRDFKDEL